MKHRAILQDSRMVHAGRPPTEGVKFGSRQRMIFSGSAASFDSMSVMQCLVRLMSGPQIFNDYLVDFDGIFG
jgi:hypothetical protein